MANGTGNARMFFEDDDGDEHEITDFSIDEHEPSVINCRCWVGRVWAGKVEISLDGNATYDPMQSPLLKQAYWPYMPFTRFSWN